MNISSVVVRCHPDRLPEVAKELQSRSGVEIHAAESGRLAVTLEDTDLAKANDQFVALHDIPGVINVTLIYQYDDSAPKTAPGHQTNEPNAERLEEIAP